MQRKIALKIAFGTIFIIFNFLYFYVYAQNKNKNVIAENISDGLKGQVNSIATDLLFSIAEIKKIYL